MLAIVAIRSTIGVVVPFPLTVMGCMLPEDDEDDARATNSSEGVGEARTAAANAATEAKVFMV